MAEFDVFPGAEAFLFKAPLYARFQCEDVQELKPLLATRMKVDGYCPDCRMLSTFVVVAPPLMSSWKTYTIFHDKLAIQCARIDTHVIEFFLFVRSTLQRTVIHKTGQYPSFADIALDESKTYNTILSKQDSSELHKAIGLAAHGIGIGSFVYIRRIFERLIVSRFKDAKDAEGWTDEQFTKLRMAERIELLKDHLPPFLVANKRLYSIVSQGIHSLGEQECLQFFEVLRTSCAIILDEDKRKKEELALKNNLERAIQKYEGGQSNT